MIKYKAKFKGLNNGPGYIPGEEYVIIISGSCIQREDGSGVFNYPSLESFFNNWDLLKTL